MRCKKIYHCQLFSFLAIVVLSLPIIESATVPDIFSLNSSQQSGRTSRDIKYYPVRYNPPSNPNPLSRSIKPEDTTDARESSQIPVEKRCTRCDSAYSDSRNPYQSRQRYDDRGGYRDRYEYDDRRYTGYEDRDRYDRYDRKPSYDRYERDRYDRDRYDPYERYDRDRYDRNPYDRNDRDRYERERYPDYDRGFGYDNRGYDRGWEGNRDSYGGSSGGYRGSSLSSGGRPEGGSGYWGGIGGGGGYASGWNYGGGGGGGGGSGGGRDDYRDRAAYDYEGFRPWDETYRGSSGWDSSGRGYYFATGIPEVGTTGYWGSGEGYASNWKYGGGLNDYRDRYGGSSYTRPRDPYEGYRGTSYLYGRPSSTTTTGPLGSEDSSDAVTQSPHKDSQVN